MRLIESWGAGFVARINVDDKWITDKRRTKLIALTGDEQIADGLMLAVWTKAQYFWRNGKHPIPRPEFDKIPRSNLVLKTKLACRRGASIYVKGSEDWFAWIFLKKEAQKLSVLSRARNKKKNSIANNLQTDSKTLASSSSSSSSSSTKNIYTPNKLSQEAIEGITQEWGETLKRWGSRKNPKTDEALLASLLQRHSMESLLDAIRGFRFESKTEKYDPAKFCNLRRLQKPDSFAYLESIGSQNRPTETKVRSVGVVKF